MRNITFSLFLALSLFSCEKVVEQVPVPPFVVAPNPFTQSIILYFDPAVHSAARVDIRIYDGRRKAVFELLNLDPELSYAINLADQPKGTYFVEASIEGEVFIQKALKAE